MLTLTTPRPTTPDATPMTQILFIRAVNLGKTNKVPMKRLMEVLTNENLGTPSFLLQSGNVIMADPQREPAVLKRETERMILAEFGVTTVAISRTPQQLAQVVTDIPLTAPEGGSVHVAFWDEEPEAQARAALAAESFSDAQLTLAESAAYMRYEGTSHTSKLSNALLERRLKVPTTARNLRTLERLLALPVVAAELA